LKAFRAHSQMSMCSFVLYELATNITFTEHIQPICLPLDDASMKRNGTRASMIGWSSSGFDANDQVQQMGVETVYFGEDGTGVTYTTSSSSTDSFVGFYSLHSYGVSNSNK